MKEVIKILVLAIIVGFIVFLGIHFAVSGGELPLQLCSNGHGT